MRVIATQTQTTRKQQDRSARRAGKRGCRARMMRIYSLIRTVPAASAAMRVSMAAKCLIHAPDQATLTTNGMPLGGCRLREFEANGPNHIGDRRLSLCRCHHRSRASRYSCKALWRRLTGYHRRSRVENKVHCGKLMVQILMSRNFNLQPVYATKLGYTHLIKTGMRPFISSP